MKRILLFVLVILACQLQAQNKLVLQPDGEKGKDAIVRNLSPNRNASKSAEFNAVALSYGGKQVVTRGLMQFDLSDIPENARIEDAHLTLYYNKKSRNFKSFLGDKKVVLRRVTEDWNENEVNWSNQPATSMQKGEIIISKSNYNTKSKPSLRLDVSDWVTDMHENPASNFGWLMQLQSEKRFTSAVFASSDHVNPEMRPKLEVSYKLATGLTVRKEVGIVTYPNPFSDQLSVKFDLTDMAKVSLSLYDLSGQLVQKLDYGLQPAGEQNIQFNPIKSLYQNGAYILKVRINDGIYMKRLLYVSE